MMDAEGNDAHKLLILVASHMQVVRQHDPLLT